MDTTRSPCVRNCCLNEQDICLGCFRSLNEIRQWNASTEEVKSDILNLAEARKSAYKLKFERNDD
jgi:predicted Fe-S protein YdhL (DUF1289 family)